MMFDSACIVSGGAINIDVSRCPQKQSHTFWKALSPGPIEDGVSFMMLQQYDQKLYIARLIYTGSYCKYLNGLGVDKHGNMPYICI